MDASPARFMTAGEESGALSKFPHVDHLCSNSRCISASGASNVMSKKVKARKVIEDAEECVSAAAESMAAQESGKSRVLLDKDDACSGAPRQNPLQVYHRRAKRPWHCKNPPSFFESLSRKIDPDSSKSRAVDVDDGDDNLRPRKKQKGLTNHELLDMCGSNGFRRGFSRTRTGVGRCNYKRIINGRKVSGKLIISKGVTPTSAPMKRWKELITEDADPRRLIGLACKVFWPIDDLWYRGSITGFNAESGLHKVLYEDGDVENLNMEKERIKLYVSRGEIRQLNLKSCSENDATVNDEMLAMAAVLNDCQDLEPGDLVWAKLTGHAMWPAVVIDEAYVGASRVLKTVQGDRAVSVQFFGTHDFARIKTKHVVPFLNGAASGYHLKCKKKRFYQSLEEAKMYLCKQQLPTEMIQQQKVADSNLGVKNEAESESEHGSVAEEENDRTIKQSFPLQIGDLCVLSIGCIVRDSKYFQKKRRIWPEGYTALRKFFSVKDPASSYLYKMEVLRNPKANSRPLFRVTLDDGSQVEGSNPDACWREIFSRIKKILCKCRNVIIEDHKFQRTGSQMFGFSNRKVSSLIQALASGGSHRKFNKICGLPAGYKPVTLGQRDLDRCDVCHMDEEYEDNLFLQCDKCRMMVHAKCYGELEPNDGSLWHCNLCRPEAPKNPPICCLCPVTGGAMKPTTDGRWAHLTCAIWIPETCLLDVKKMEPIDGLNRINKDRWKLLCSICGVPYGACIQCSNSSCRVAYHPLCARSCGLCNEPEDVDQLHHMSPEEDEDQCIPLLSFCRKHKQPSNECPPPEECQAISARPCSAYVPPQNPSGSVRCEPYNFFGRRGQREPQVLAAASVKRLFVEDRPYLVSGCRQNGLKCSSPRVESSSITSVAEKYVHMRSTFRKRLAFGKSRIHGFGVFAKVGHKAGDMVIEYAGETVRPPIADLRENLIYNSLVGSGTYIFRLNDHLVIDATKAGSISQLINHSCDPNCYSRDIVVDGEEHIIIFARRDIKEWEELTYDYRFFSIDEDLACYCGSPRCRGVVNDAGTEGRVAKLWVPRSELIPWSG